MATINDINHKIFVRIEPVKIQEVGEPTWIETSIEIEHERKKVVGLTVSFTHGDFSAIKEDLLNLIRNKTVSVDFSTTENDLILQIHPDLSGKNFFFAIWIGEPYILMRGFRFAIEASQLEGFLTELIDDESMMLSA